MPEKEYPYYFATIMKMDTGEIRKRKQELAWKEGSHWWWTEGNFGCDCNREWEFQRAGNEELTPHEKLQCGSKRYKVLQFDFPDGSSMAGDDYDENQEDLDAIVDEIGKLAACSKEGCKAEVSGWIGYGKNQVKAFCLEHWPVKEGASGKPTEVLLEDK